MSATCSANDIQDEGAKSLANVLPNLCKIKTLGLS